VGGAFGFEEVEVPGAAEVGFVDVREVLPTKGASKRHSQQGWRVMVRVLEGAG
jgi:hypothetical protein